MRVAISTSVIQRGRSGVGQYVLALVRALLAQTHRPELVLLVLEEDQALFEFARGHAQIVTVPEHFRPAVKDIWWHQTALPRLLRQQGIDVVHVPSYRRLLAASPCPRVATIHDLAPFHVCGKYDAARSFYGRVVVKQLARRQDRIIAISRYTAGDVERFFGIGLARQELIYNGIDHNRFYPADRGGALERVRQRWGMTNPFLLYVSRLEHPGKNHVRLIQAFTEFKARTSLDWDLVLGGSDWHGAEAVRAAAARSPVASAIRFLGFVEDGALPDLYRAAGVLVYPSLFEGFGLPPVEAMACGCPVLSSSRGALDEVIADAAERVDPESLESLTTGLTRVVCDPNRREQLRQAGLLNARRFDWATTAAQVCGVYQQVTRRGCGSIESGVGAR